MRLPTVLYEDDSLIAFDKPAGLLVAPDRWDKDRDNLMNAVHEAMGRQVANVHRLDAGTSGVLLCAKTKAALDAVSGQFQAKTVEKTYLAMAAVLPVERAMKVAAPLRAEGGGLPANFAIDLALGPDEHQPGRMRVFRGRGGKPSRTEVRVLEAFGRFAWLECRPLTGRTHQIRLHLAAVGAPVLGDPFYGDPDVKLLLSELKRRYKGRRSERPLIDRMALHACRLSIIHPDSGLTATIEAPLPNEFEVALKYLRRFCPAAGSPAPVLNSAG